MHSQPARRRRLIALCLFAVALGAGPARAQRPVDLRVVSYPAPDGIAGAALHDLERDRDGFLWIASDAGMVRFDGQAFRTFTVDDGLPANRILSLYRNRRGELFAVSEKGIVRVEHTDRGVRFVHMVSGGAAYSDTLVTDPGPLFQDFKGKLWGSDRFRIFRIEDDGLVPVWMPDPSSREGSGAGFLFAQFDYHRLLVVSRAGPMALLDTRDDSMKPLSTPAGLTTARAVMRLDQGRALIGTGDAVYEITEGRDGILTSRRLVDTPPVTVLTRLADGTVAIGTESAGLFRLDTAGELQPLPSLPAPRIQAAVPEADGRLFVLTQAGLSIVWPPFFETYLDLVSSAIAPMGDFGDEGFLHVDEDRLRLVRTGSEEPVEQVLLQDTPELSAVTAGPDAVWAGTLTGLVLRLVEGRSPERFTLPSDQPVVSLQADSDGSVWIAQRGRVGVVRVSRDGAIDEYGPDQGIRSQVNVLRVLDRELYAGITARSDYVLRYDPSMDRFGSLGPASPAGHPVEVQDLASVGGALWLGTDRGLSVLNRHSVHRPTAAASLTSTSVLALASDPTGGLWIGAVDGLYRLEDGQFASYELLDESSEIGVLPRAIHIDSRGRPWIGTSRTISRWHDHPLALLPTPKPRLQTLTADGVNLVDPEDVTFGVVIQAAVAVPNYPGSRMVYRHRLLGFSDDWSPESDEPTVHLIGLNEDSYVLEIQARQAGYTWSPSVRIPLTVRAPWHRSSWVIVVLFLFGAFTVFAVLQVFTSVHERHKVENSLVEKADELARAKSELECTVRELDLARGAAERATAAKSAFLASMSHEIRTPMSGVIGMASLLDQTPLSHEQREYVGVIRSSGESLLGLINDILDFSKIEAGRVDLDVHPFGLRRLVESAIDTIAHAASSKGVEVTYLLRQGVPSRVSGDSTRLRQVLINLLSNAVKFTDAGNVTIQIDKFPDSGEDHHLAFSVADTGLGIPPDRVDAVFDRFTQVDAATSRHYGGTGLGLAICRRLVELMEGEISVRSELGKGSTFRFDVWLGPADGIEDVEDVPLHVLDGRRVLLVESSAALRRMVRHEAAAVGLAVTVAEHPDAIRPEDAAAVEICLVGSPADADVRAALDAVRSRLGPDVPIIRLGRLGEAAPPGAPIVARPLRQRPLLAAVAAALGERRANLEEMPAGLPTTAPVPRGDLRILVVEDNAINQKVAVRMLERLGYPADVAASGVEAIDAVRRARYDLVLMDVRMPDMDGIEAARVIRHELPADRVPRLVAMTANSMGSDREWYRAAGMDDFLAKPFSLGSIGAVLARAAARTGEAAPPEPGGRAPDRPPSPSDGTAHRLPDIPAE
jgi:signal transduction histidine kinase/CheY-like chemotaxis protein/ligand-binding sensor domain-containing protein